MAEVRDTTAHSDHDLLLVAGLADRELAGDEHARARAQIAVCAECAGVHADLVSLARATHDLPPIARPRDFTLRPEDARRLRPNLLRRMVVAFGTSRDGFSRQLALGLTTIGLAGLLVGVLPGALSLGGATGGVTDQIYEAPAGQVAPELAGEPTQPATIAMSEETELESADDRTPIVVASLALLAAGLVLGATRIVVRRGRGNHPEGRLV